MRGRRQKGSPLTGRKEWRTAEERGKQSEGAAGKWRERGERGRQRRGPARDAKQKRAPGGVVKDPGGKGRGRGPITR